MRNRAKCKLCQSIIESFHTGDHVSCKCDEISVSEGEALRCSAKNWSNFMRIDDEENEIIVTVNEVSSDLSKPKKKDLLNMLEEMIKNIEKLPPNGMLSPINHYDFASALLLLLSIFREDCKDLT